MYKEKVDLSVKSIKELISTLTKVFENEDISNRSYENWTFPDTLNHIASWIKYSREIIFNIINKKEINEPDNIETFIEKFNYENFNLKKNNTLKEAEKNILFELNEYEKIINLFNEDYYASVFNKMPVYKYIMIDLYIHPVLHFMYYALIKNDSKTFINILNESNELFMFYSNGNYNVYILDEFFYNSELKNDAFKKLKTDNNDTKSDLLKKVIEINLNKS